MNVKRAHAVVVLGLCIYGASAAAFTLPAPFEAEYEGSRFPLKAKAKISLSRAGDYYRYTLRGSVHAAMYKWTEVYDCSVVQLRAHEFYPLEYVHRDKRNPRRNIQARFDWQRRSVRIATGDGGEQQLDDLPRVAWDLMSVQLQMRADVPGAAPGTNFDYAVVGKDKITHHRATVEAIEPVDGNKYALEAVKIRAQGPKGVNFFWFAKDYAWLPVRIDLGGVTLQLVSSPEQAARPPADPPSAAPHC